MVKFAVPSRSFSRLRHSFVPTPKAMADGVSDGAQSKAGKTKRPEESGVANQFLL